MTRNPTGFALLVSVVVLSACGGSSIEVDRIGEPGITQSGENVGSLAVSYNEGDNTLTVTDGLVTYTYVAEGTGDNGAIAGYLRSSSDYIDYALRGETSSGSGEAFLVNSTEDGYEAAAVFLVRMDTTNVPASGTASFTGDYSALYFLNEAEDAVGEDNIYGDVTLDANFDDSMVSGSITNRVTFTNIDLGDVALGTSSISNGAFSGTTSSGSGGIFVASDGTYEGIFTGVDADEVVGSVYIPMTYGGDLGFEMGIFVVEEILP